MGGSNLYCCICNGPTCRGFTDVDGVCAEAGIDGDDLEFPDLPGVNVDDLRWIRNCVAIYADCISPHGTYNWHWHVDAPDVHDTMSDSEDEDEDEGDVSTQTQGNIPDDDKDPVTRPAWALGLGDHLGYNEYPCAESCDYALLAHEHCIRLAAARAKKLQSDDAPADPAVFFWTKQGPLCSYICEVDMKSDASDAMQEYLQASKRMKTAAGDPKPAEFRWPAVCTAEEEKGEYAWLEGCGQDYEQKAEYGVVHLKRPDRFPRVHDLPLSTPEAPASVFPFRCPADITLAIAQLLGGDDLVALSGTSRAWRAFLRTRLAQRHVWLRQVRRDPRFVPTEADWTRSAKDVNAALAEPREMDWRRYYVDVRGSPNMQNRARILRAIDTIKDALDSYGNGDEERE